MKKARKRSAQTLVAPPASPRGAVSPRVCGSHERRIRALRRKIDRADRALLLALGERMRTAAEIGAVKIEAQLPLEQGARWADIMRSRLALAARLKLEKQFVGSLYELIHVEALSIQARLAAKATGKAPQAERTREKMPKARRKREAK